MQHPYYLLGTNIRYVIDIHGLPELVVLVLLRSCIILPTGWEFEEVDRFYEVQLALSPNHTPSALRHLHISGNLSLKIPVIPSHWSRLTRIYLFVTEISLNFWFSFIRAVPDLQSGHFHIDMLASGDYIQPTRCTLPELSMLNLSVYAVSLDLEFPLGVLFTELHLPALRDLSLSSDKSWSDHRALTNVYTMLNSAPAVTTLTLEANFLSLEHDAEYSRAILPLIADAGPIWSRVTLLVHLRLHAVDILRHSQAQAEEERETFVRNIFHHHSRWLDLHNPSCPIKKITIVDRIVFASVDGDMG